MKHLSSIIISLVCLSTIACKGNVQEAQSPNQAANVPPPAPEKKGIEKCESQDGFDTAGKYVASGSRWTYETGKEYAGKAYDAAVEYYREYEENKKKEEAEKSEP